MHKRYEFGANAGDSKQRASNKSAGQNRVCCTGMKLFYVEQFASAPGPALRFDTPSGIVGLL